VADDTGGRTPGGCFGRALVVDVGTGASSVLPLPEQVLREHLGGVGLGTWLLTELGPPGVDPLAPEAPLAFVFSPLVGTPLTTSAKFAVVAKSPLTGLLTDALASSHFAISGKLTGHDAIVLVGRAERPSVVRIEGGSVVVEDAGKSWGRTAAEAEAEVRGRLGGGWQVASIGTAGERGVRYATISHDGRHAGRGGLGAVLGAKQVKALAVHATTKVAPADPEGVLAAAKDLRERSRGRATAKYRELGTMANVLAFNALSTLPTRNFTASTFEGAAQLSSEELSQAREVVKTSCASCSIGCEHLYKGPKGRTGRSPCAHGAPERLGARPAVRGVRPRRGHRRERPLRRPRDRHHLGRRHDRLGDGVRRAGAARRAVAALRRRGRAAAGPRRDRLRRRARDRCSRSARARRRGRRAGLVGLRRPRQGPRAARLRAADHAGDGARHGRQRPRRRPQPQRGVRGRPVR
jgi:hypothetical protein